MGVREDLESLIGKTVTKIDLVMASESYDGSPILLAHIHTEGGPAPWRNPVVIGLRQQMDYGDDEAFVVHLGGSDTTNLCGEEGGHVTDDVSEATCQDCLEKEAEEPDDDEPDGDDEPEHRYNSAPFCAKCGGPCLQRNAEDDVNCRHCGAWLFPKGPSWVDTTNGDACPVHSESTVEATGVSTNLPHEPERPAQHGWAWAMSDDPVWQQTVKVTEALWPLGITRAALYQDGTSGGLICVRIPLDDSIEPDQGRALFVATEDHDPATATWHGQIIEADGEAGNLLPLAPATELQVDQYGSGIGLTAEDVARAVADTVSSVLGTNTD